MAWLCAGSGTRASSSACRAGREGSRQGRGSARGSRQSRSRQRRQSQAPAGLPSASRPRWPRPPRGISRSQAAQWTPRWRVTSFHATTSSRGPTRGARRGGGGWARAARPAARRVFRARPMRRARLWALRASSTESPTSRSTSATRPSTRWKVSSRMWRKSWETESRRRRASALSVASSSRGTRACTTRSLRAGDGCGGPEGRRGEGAMTTR